MGKGIGYWYKRNPRSIWPSLGVDFYWSAKISIATLRSYGLVGGQGLTLVINVTDHCPLDSGADREKVEDSS